MTTTKQSLEDTQITHTDFAELVQHAAIVRSLLAPYPRIPDPIKETSDLLNPYSQFCADWDIAHLAHGMMGEIFELGTVVLDAPEDVREHLEFCVSGTILELGDITFYLVGLIDRTPELFSKIEATLESHSINYPRHNFVDLFQAILYYAEQFTNGYKRFMFYNDPIGVEHLNLDTLANTGISLLRGLKAHGEIMVMMVDAFSKLSNMKSFENSKIHDRVTDALKIKDNNPEWFTNSSAITTILTENRKKLKKRYPAGTFTKQDAIERKDMAQ